MQGSDVGKLVPHVTQIAHRQDHTARVGNQRYLGDLVADLLLVLSPQEHFLHVGSHRAAGELDVLGPHDSGDILQGEAVFAQDILGYLDVDLVLFRTEQLRLRNRRQQEQFLTHPFGQGAERHFCFERLVVRSEHAHSYGLVAQRDLLHLGVFRQLGEAGDSVDLGADFVEHLLNVGNVALKLHDHEAGTFPRDRVDLLDPVDRLDRFLDLLADALFHLLGACPGIGHRNLNDLQLELGEDFPVQEEEAHRPYHEYAYHQRVHGGRVANGPLDKRLHRVLSSVAIATSWAFTARSAPSVRWRTVIPSIASAKGLTTTWSPAERSSPSACNTADPSSISTT